MYLKSSYLTFGSESSLLRQRSWSFLDFSKGFQSSYSHVPKECLFISFRRGKNFQFESHFSSTSKFNRTTSISVKKTTITMSVMHCSLMPIRVPLVKSSLTQKEPNSFSSESFSILENYKRKMLRALSKGFVKEVEALYKAILKIPLKPNKVIYNCMIDSCAQLGDLEKAIEYFELIKSIGEFPDVTSYNGLIKCCKHRNQCEFALETFDRMIVAGLQPNLITFEHLINVFSEVDLQRALDQLKKLREYQLKPTWTAFYKLINACMYHHNPSQCLDLVEEMKREDIVPPSTAVFSAISNLSAKLCDGVSLLKTVKLLKENSTIFERGFLLTKMNTGAISKNLDLSLWAWNTMLEQKTQIHCNDIFTFELQ